MTQPQPPRPPEFKFQVPDHLAGGVYSNLVGVWHTPYEFTLDFAVMQPGELDFDEDGNQRVVVPSRVVARVKLPPAMMFELLQALNRDMTLYEEQLGGPIPRPGNPGPDPQVYPPGA
jgi:hypothetical protein